MSLCCSNIITWLSICWTNSCLPSFYSRVRESRGWEVIFTTPPLDRHPQRVCLNTRYVGGTAILAAAIGKGDDVWEYRLEGQSETRVWLYVYEAARMIGTNFSPFLLWCWWKFDHFATCLQHAMFVVIFCYCLCCCLCNRLWNKSMDMFFFHHWHFG